MQKGLHGVVQRSNWLFKITQKSWVSGRKIVKHFSEKCLNFSTPGSKSLKNHDFPVEKSLKKIPKKLFKLLDPRSKITQKSLFSGRKIVKNFPKEMFKLLDPRSKITEKSWFSGRKSIKKFPQQLFVQNHWKIMISRSSIMKHHSTNRQKISKKIV